MAVAIAAVAYSALSLWRAYLDVREIDLVRRALIAPDQVSLAEVSNLGHAENVVDDLSLMVFAAMFLAMMIWMRIVQTSLIRAGRAERVKASPAYQVWRIAIWVSLVAVIFLRTSSPTSLDAAVSVDQRAIVFLCVRAAIGLLYMWVALSTAKMAADAFADPSDSPITLIRVDGPSRQPDVYDLANADYAPDGTRLNQ